MQWRPKAARKELPSLRPAVLSGCAVGRGVSVTAAALAQPASSYSLCNPPRAERCEPPSCLPARPAELFRRNGIELVLNSKVQVSRCGE